MTNCIECSTFALCSKCSTLFLDSDNKGCVNDCSSSTQSNIFFILNIIEIISKVQVYG